jgi:hypothetical protein
VGGCSLLSAVFHSPPLPAAPPALAHVDGGTSTATTALPRPLSAPSPPAPADALRASYRPARRLLRPPRTPTPRLPRMHSFGGFSPSPLTCALAPPPDCAPAPLFVGLHPFSVCVIVYFWFIFFYGGCVAPADYRPPTPLAPAPGIHRMPPRPLQTSPVPSAERKDVPPFESSRRCVFFELCSKGKTVCWPRITSRSAGRSAFLAMFDSDPWFDDVEHLLRAEKKLERLFRPETVRARPS